MLHRTFFMSTAALKRNISRIATLPMVATTATSAVQQNLQVQTKRTFYNTQIRFNSVAQELQEALQSEIKAEMEVEEENLGGKAPPAMPGFKIEKNGAEFTLRKTYGSEKITVMVNVNHSVDIEDGENEFNENASSTDVEHDPVPVALPPVRVEVTKGDQRLIFFLQMAKNEETGEYDYEVEEFLIAPAAKGEEYEDVPDEVYSSSGKYIDPQLHDLLFIRYLEERGFNTQFCHDLVKFATHYEHQQYVKMLEKMKKFVSP